MPRLDSGRAQSLPILLALAVHLPASPAVAACTANAATGMIEGTCTAAEKAQVVAANPGLHFMGRVVDAPPAGDAPPEKSLNALGVPPRAGEGPRAGGVEQPDPAVVIARLQGMKDAALSAGGVGRGGGPDFQRRMQALIGENIDKMIAAASDPANLVNPDLDAKVDEEWFRNLAQVITDKRELARLAFRAGVDLGLDTQGRQQRGGKPWSGEGLNEQDRARYRQLLDAYANGQAMDRLHTVPLGGIYMQADASFRQKLPPDIQVGHNNNWTSGPGAKDPTAHKYAGDTYMSLNNPSAARDAYGKAISLNPSDAAAFAGRGAANVALGDYDAASNDARRALELDPSNQSAFSTLKMSEGRANASPGSGVAGAPSLGGGAGRGFAGAEAFGGARAQFAGSGYSAGAAAAARFNDQARGALRMGDDASALDFAARALSSDPRNALAYFLRASALYRQGKFREAADAAAKGLEVDPKNAALLQVGSRSLLKDKDYKGAAALANRALELDGQAAWAFAARGYAAAGLGDRAAALEDLKRAAAIDPAFQSAYEKALRTPTEEDLALLFPGEDSGEGKAAAAAPSRGRSFSVVTGAAAVGGLLLALGLLSVFAKPLSEGASSVFTRLTRRSPAVSAVPAAAPSRAGLLQGKFELGKQIGQGGMGLVFDGTDRSLNRRVAIKRMRDEIRLDPRERSRFVSEAKTVAALHHPNIVDIYAVVEEGDDLHLVFEYVEGRTLHELLGSGRVAPADAAKVVRGAAAALDFAHSRGVIHRDMKPSNLMLDGRGNVKVMDFGIARAAKDVMTRGAMTNTIVGTPPYMAPEQEQGQVRKESDVYALAVCAYELLCGRLPFPGVGAGMLMNKINMSYVPPSKMAEHLPAALDGVFVKAFQPEPDKRFRSAGEFAGALEAALSAPVKA